MDIKNLLKNLKLHENTISMILGAVVIMVTGILIVNYFAGKRGQTIPPVDIEDSSSLPKNHTVAEGEDLWKISEKYYGTGYNWVDIATANDISNPNQIKKSQELTIPDVSPRLTQGESPTPEVTQTAQISPIPTVTGQALKVGKTVHKIAKGESLWKISEKYYSSGYNWVDIAKENNITNPSLVEEGQELIIPDVEPKTIDVASGNPEAISGATYTVAKDDSLWKIAVRAYGDGYKWADIAKENKLENPGLIHPGNILSLPR